MPPAFLHRLGTPRLLLPGGALAAALVLLVGQPGQAQQAGYGQTLGTSPQEQQIYDYSPGGSPSGRGGSILDTTNPIELMNKLRRGTAMEEATTPESAIDQALRDLEVQAAPAAP